MLEPFLLERYFAEHEFATPHLLCSSDLESVEMRELVATADDETAALWHDLRLGYTETTGHPLLRAELAALYETVDADEVVTFAGASEAITCLVSGLVQPGDHVIATWPAYQSLYAVAEGAGADVTTIELHAEDDWAIDLDAIRAALRPGTRLIVVNAPHNPTGMLPSRETWRGLAALAADAGATLLCDEVYRLLEHDPADRLDRRRRPRRPRRLGRCAVEELRPRRPAHRLARDAQQRHPGRGGTRQGLRLDVQRGAGRDPRRHRAPRRRPDPRSQPRARAATTWRWSTTCSTATRIGCTWHRPRAGAIGFPRLLGDEPVDDFCARLRAEQGVLLLPGTVYGHAGNHFRIGFGRLGTPAALARLDAFLQTA